MTPECQPLDISVNKLFKDSVKFKFEFPTYRIVPMGRSKLGLGNPLIFIIKVFYQLMLNLESVWTSSKSPL